MVITIVGLILGVTISPIGSAYAHVSCPNSGGSAGVSFQALWTAVCDLQSQIDNLQKNTPVTKEVQVTAASCLNDATKYKTPFGWCPDGVKYQFLINDPAVTQQSVIATTTVAPTGNNEAPVHCSTESVNFVEGPDSGFIVKCDSSPLPGTGLNYIIFNPAGSVSSVPFALDNYASAIIDGDTSTTQSVTLSTTYSNDIIFVEVANGDSRQTQSISDTAGLTWSLRTVYSGIGDAETVELWYAVAPSQLSSDTITVNMPSRTDLPWSVIAFGISGANTANSFDGSTDATNKGSSGSSATVSTTTNNSNEILIGSLVLDNGNSQPTPSNGMTLVASPQLNPPDGMYRGAVEIQTISSAGNQQAGFDLGSNDNWGIIATAVKSH